MILVGGPATAATTPSATGEGSCEPAGEPVVLTVVGIVRHAGDLAANTQENGQLFLPAAWAAPDVSAAELRAAIDRRLPSRGFFESPLADEVDTLDEAIGYEARAAQAFAALTALAALVFVGQAIVRQARREAVDLPIISYLGGSRRMAIASLLLRSAVTATAAAVVATAAAYLVSPVGPVGVARRAETGSHRLDLPVLLGGLAVLRCLGFTRRQVASSVSWQARTIGIVSLALGIPLGLILGRWGWWVLAADVGLTNTPVVKPWVSSLVGVGVVTVAVSLAMLPGRRAARARPSVVLRAIG